MACSSSHFLVAFLYFRISEKNLPSHMNTTSNRCTSNLKRHLKVHSGNKCYKCTQSKKCFNCSSNLKRRLRIHNVEKPYKCTHCKKCFSRSSHLKTHLRIHSGDKPFKCMQCHKCFKDDKTLKRHKSSECSTEDRENFTCWMCGEYCHSVCGILSHMSEHGMRKS